MKIANGACPPILTPGEISKAILHWDFSPDSRLDTARLRSRQISDVRLSEISGTHCAATRTDVHRERDGGDYVGIVCKLEGTERSGSGDGSWTLTSGDVMVWRNCGPMNFTIDDWSRKVILLVPEARFATVLKSPLPAACWCLPGTTALGTLISSFMTALAGNLDRLDDRSAESAVEMALDLVGSAIHSMNHEDAPKRSTLYGRVLNFIDRRLEDSDLSPARIAAAHGISTRYLHMLFANNGATVSGWIRERRLQCCREEIELARKGMSLTEIAHFWGFSDGAHFSRSFKKRYGVSPKAWRAQHHNDAGWQDNSAFA